MDSSANTVIPPVEVSDPLSISPYEKNAVLTGVLMSQSPLSDDDVTSMRGEIPPSEMYELVNEFTQGELINDDQAATLRNFFVFLERITYSLSEERGESLTHANVLEDVLDIFNSNGQYSASLEKLNKLMNFLDPKSSNCVVTESGEVNNSEGTMRKMGYVLEMPEET